jgi:hypothetical protein
MMHFYFNKLSTTLNSSFAFSLLFIGLEESMSSLIAVSLIHHTYSIKQSTQLGQPLYQSVLKNIFHNITVGHAGA